MGNSLLMLPHGDFSVIIDDLSFLRKVWEEEFAFRVVFTVLTLYMVRIRTTDQWNLFIGIA